MKSLRWLTSLAVLLTASFTLALSPGQPLSPILPQEAPDAWQNLAAGIDYQLFILHDDKYGGDNQVFVGRMDRARKDVTLDTSLANARLNNLITSGSTTYYSWETIRDQTQRYDGVLNTWGGNWGSRNQVVLAINGYYHEDKINGLDTSMPERGQVQAGWYAKRYYNFESTKDENGNSTGGSGFVWTQTGEAFLGGCVNHVAKQQKFFHFNPRTSGTPGDKNITDINVLPQYRAANSLILYTPQFDTRTPTNDTYEIRVELSQPAIILPEPGMITGTVKSKGWGGATPLSFDGIVLSASGDIAGSLASWDIQPGDQIGLSQNITHFVDGCSVPSYSQDHLFTRAYASLGTDFHFIENGQRRTFTNQGTKSTYPQPRTAIAFNDRYVYFIVVDGHHKGVSMGMSIEQLGRFAHDYLGATEAATLDSNISSTFVASGKVVNNVICNADYLHRNTACGWPGLSAESMELADLGGYLPPPQPVAADANGEPRLVNGLMMISVLPAAYSNGYEDNQSLASAVAATLRLGPGSNYGAIGSVPAQSNLTILPHPQNGVQATGESWWKVSYNGQEGWFPQSDLPWDWTPTDWLFFPSLFR